MLNRFRIVSMAIAGCMLAGISSLSTAAEDVPEQLALDGSVQEFVMCPEDQEDSTYILSYELTLESEARVDFHVVCNPGGGYLNYGLHGEMVTQDFDWRIDSDLQYHSNQISPSDDAVTTGDVYYILAPGTYYFWLEGVNFDDWTTDLSGSITAEVTSLPLNTPYAENRSRSAAASIAVGTHCQTVLTGDLSHTDVIGEALYDQWYTFTVENDGMYYLLGDLTSTGTEDANNAVWIYKEGETDGNVVNFDSTFRKEKYGRSVYPMELEAGTYEMEVTCNGVNGGGIAYEFGVYPFLRGDATLDGTVDLADASAVLKYYAQAAAGMEAQLTDGTDEYIEVLAWLQGDATRYNWTTRFYIEEDDVLALSDASSILSYYAKNAAGLEPDWDEEPV